MLTLPTLLPHCTLLEGSAQGGDCVARYFYANRRGVFGGSPIDVPTFIRRAFAGITARVSLKIPEVFFKKR